MKFSFEHVRGRNNFSKVLEFGIWNAEQGLTIFDI